ncbi:hypothetical protein GALL_96620 [mine drainage metagenome]|uniref:Uncharacterized protein n=1 Tax=mine drainage metagenome TaxID=410659 RepID=A0A1J5SI58_9ZZZZ
MRNPRHEILTFKKEITLGTGTAFTLISFTHDMNRTLHHQRGCAGTSITKATVHHARVQMRPVTSCWNKQFAGVGSQA